MQAQIYIIVYSHARFKALLLPRKGKICSAIAKFPAPGKVLPVPVNYMIFLTTALPLMLKQGEEIHDLSYCVPNH